MAVSDDGVRWRRVRGPLEGGACFDPAPEDGAFDAVHVGVGDVVQLPNGTLWMYYFGGSTEEVMEGRPGLRMQVGMAASEDGGLSWQRLLGGEPVLKPGAAGEFDAVFVAWPRVLPPWATKGVPGIPDGRWYMSYHTASFAGGMSWAAGAAFSDDGVHWTKAPGPVLGSSEGDLWDCRGVGVRCVRPAGGGREGLVMLYEAVDSAGDHAIGLADSLDGVSWSRRDLGSKALGGPLLAKAVTESDWDSRVVGTPYAVPPQSPGQAWRLYYVGETVGRPGLAIGLAQSEDGEGLELWRRQAPRAAVASPSDGVFGRAFKRGSLGEVRNVEPPAGGATGGAGALLDLED